MGPRLDRAEAERRRLALQGVHLAQDILDLAPERGAVAGRFTQDRVDHLQRHGRLAEEGAHLAGVEMHDPEQRFGLRLRLLAQARDLARERDALRDVGDRDEQGDDQLAVAHAMEIKVQMARLAAARAVVEADLDLLQRIDRPHEVFAGALRPQDLDELLGGVERAGGDDRSQQVAELEARDVVALEEPGHRFGVHRADAARRIDQEQALAHRA